MSVARLISAAILLVLLGACEDNAGPGGERAEPPAAEQAGTTAPASGKAEEGQFSMKGPGFDLKIDMPEGAAGSAGQDGDNDLLYPGASISGMHIEAAPGAQPNSGVELRFTSTAAPDQVAAWYRDPARAGRFQVESFDREGESFVIAGTQASDGDPFALRLSPVGGGGTDGRLTLSGSR